jgi:hypothetical protein
VLLPAKEKVPLASDKEPPDPEIVPEKVWLFPLVRVSSFDPKFMLPEPVIVWMEEPDVAWLISKAPLLEKVEEAMDPAPDRNTVVRFAIVAVPE